MKLKLSSRMDPDEYRKIMFAERKKLTSLEFITDIHNDYFKDHYTYGLCSFGYQSDCQKFQCPFDYRKETQDESVELTFKSYKDTDDSRCKYFCSISSLLYRLGLDNKIIVNIEEHQFTIANYLKAIMKDFLLKI